MHYEINVSLNGVHYFGTHKRSLRDLQSAQAMKADFIKRFPESEGFKVSLSEFTAYSTEIK